MDAQNIRPGKTLASKKPHLFLLLLSFGFYAFTSCRYVTWIDSSLHACYVDKLSFHPWVNIHNLFILIGWLWCRLLPIGEMAFRLNLLCALFGSVTVYFIFLTGLKVTENPKAALYGSLAVLFSHTLWWHSTTTEVYTLNTALLAVMVYFLAVFSKTQRSSDLFKASFFFGLACSNHVMMGLFLFSFLGLLCLPDARKVVRRPGVLSGLLWSFLAGFSLYIIVFLAEFYFNILALPEFSLPRLLPVFSKMINEATGGFFKQHMFPRYALPPAEAVRIYARWHLNYLFLWVMNYPSAALILGLAGFAALAKKKEGRLLSWFILPGAAVHAAWTANYQVWDQYAFGLPTWVLFGLFVILGLDKMLRKVRWKHLVLSAYLVTLPLGPYLYSHIPQWSKQEGFWNDYFKFFRFTANLWDASAYFSDPDKRDYDLTQRICGSILEKLPPGAILYDSDAKTYYPLQYYFRYIHNKRPDIQLYQFFGPTATQEEAFHYAQGIMTQLQNGKDVFIVSPYWPEFMILTNLYRISENRWGEENFEGLDDFLAHFTHYEFKKITLLEDKPYYIYKIEKRRP